jgi:hypothetical protein
MIKKVVRTFLASLLIATLFLPPIPIAKACGPYFPVAILIQSKHPDLPLDQFAAGKLGIVQSNYARSYLVVAYRYLSGGTFSTSEQKQLYALWAKRLGREQDWLRHDPEDASQNWFETRKKISGLPDPQYTKPTDRFWPWASVRQDYGSFLNCLDDAFATATRTVQLRAKQFGSNSSELKNWVEAQDLVFRNCDGRDPVSGNNFIPAEVSLNQPATIRSDREYQIAAAHFYALHWEEARTRFSKIAKDSASPWKPIAALAAVRCTIREATLHESDPAKVRAELLAADERLRKLQDDPSMRELRSAIWRLRGFVEFRTAPSHRLAELARAIQNGHNSATFGQDVDDYTELLDHVLGDSPADDQDYTPPQKLRGLMEKSGTSRKSSDMTDWILTSQASTEKATTHALAKWNETHSAPWLIAALSKAEANTPGLPELLSAASELPSDSRAHLTAEFHRSRLLNATNKQEEARQIANAALALPSNQIPESAHNLFLALQMKMARNLDEFLQFAPRIPNVITMNMEGFDIPDMEPNCVYGSWKERQACEKQPPHSNLPPPSPPLFDADAAVLLSQGTPTSVLVQAAANEHLPKNLRRQVAQSAWVRAIVLNDETAAHQLVPVLASLAPDLAPLLQSFDSADSAELRRFASTFLLLHSPEFHPYVSSGIGRETLPGKIDNYRDNWWCSLKSPKDAIEGDYESAGYYYGFTRLDGPLANLYVTNGQLHPAFLTDTERQTAEVEWTALTKFERASDWLAKETLTFAKAHPDDPRIAEALHLVVRVTRYSCDGGSTSNSKAAFQLLHKRYPKSEWAKKTPYWY